MEIRLILATFDKEVYNSNTLHPLQSWEWGEARKQTGLKIIRFGEFSEKILKKSYLMTLHKVPMTNFKIINSKHPLFTQWTIIMDLSKSEKILMEKLKPKTRYNIKLAQKKGVF